jgi:hypothetical protein
MLSSDPLDALCAPTVALAARVPRWASAAPRQRARLEPQLSPNSLPATPPPVDREDLGLHRRRMAMRRLCRCLLMALAIALCAAPVAGAHDQLTAGAGVIAPARGGGLSGGELMGEAQARQLEVPADELGSGRCFTVARNVLAPDPGMDGTATCTGPRRTRLLLSFGFFCTDVTDNVVTEQQQLACAVAGAQSTIREMNITVDAGPTVNIRTPRFAASSPQCRVHLAPGNFLGVPTGPATFTTYGWAAVIRHLRPGPHTATLQIVLAPGNGEPFTSTIFLNIVRGGHSNHQDLGGRDCID